MGKFVIEPRALLNAAVATADLASNDSKVDVGFQTHASCQVSWTGLTGTGTAKLQESNDGVTWEDVAGATVSVTGSTGKGMLRMPNNVVTKWLALNYAHGTVSAGTITATFHAKG